MLPTPFLFIWVLNILIGYLKLLRNICVFFFFCQLGIFVNVKTFQDFSGLFSDAFTPVWKLLSVSNSKLSIS